MTSLEFIVLSAYLHSPNAHIWLETLLTNHLSLEACDIYTNYYTNAGVYNTVVPHNVFGNLIV